jgi:hypothetical protein
MLLRMELWTWLNVGQHSSAVQALAALLFGIPTILFFAAATVAAVRQAKVAKLQTEIAEKALREQSRPVLSLEKRHKDLSWRHPDQRLLLSNLGDGAAYKTAIELMRETFVKTSSLGTYTGFQGYLIIPKQLTLLAFPTFMASSLVMVYESVQGERFVSRFSFPDDELRVSFGVDIPMLSPDAYSFPAQ